MTLSQQQRLFTRLIATLILHAYSQGYELTFGDAYRDPRLHGEVGVKRGYSAANSLHKSRLAVDLNLFKNGKYLEDSAAHKTLGEYWESLHPLCTWGGNFKPTPDGNHYSMQWQGRK